jgi:hypothetical protein
MISLLFEVKKIWKDSVYRVEQAVSWKNRSGQNDSSGEEEDQGVQKFTKLHFVHYWYHLSEEHPNLFQAMKGGLGQDVSASRARLRRWSRRLPKRGKRLTSRISYDNILRLK